MNIHDSVKRGYRSYNKVKASNGYNSLQFYPFLYGITFLANKLYQNYSISQKLFNEKKKQEHKLPLRQAKMFNRSLIISDPKRIIFWEQNVRQFIETSQEPLQVIPKFGVSQRRICYYDLLFVLLDRLSARSLDQFVYLWLCTAK